MTRRVAELVAKVTDGEVVEDYKPRSVNLDATTAAVRVGKLEVAELEDLEIATIGVDQDGPDNILF